jgi:hypothetical protein
MNRHIFGEIVDGEIGEIEFNEWLIQYTEEVWRTAKKDDEINLTPLKEWANSREKVWDSFEIGYETARQTVKDLLGIGDE